MDHAIREDRIHCSIRHRQTLDLTEAKLDVREAVAFEAHIVGQRIGGTLAKLRVAKSGQLVIRNSSIAI